MSTDISGLTGAGDALEEIPVAINYDIIRLFSEGLYRSPHKAVEELVSNGYDAGARQVHVLLPEPTDGQTTSLAPLWVIDDGHGMNVDGFRQLWRVADSTKNKSPEPNGRPPIGQFGIGKLAAYVLAWRLTHISRVEEKLRLTTMDFHKVTGRQTETPDQVHVSLREVDDVTAQAHLDDIKQRDPVAWALLFDVKNQARTWTAAGLSNFKDLYNQLSAGTLRWVLRTGLPLHTDFAIFLNGDRLVSSKQSLKEIKSIAFCDDLPGIGEVTGTARIHEKQLKTGKSELMGRSNGFFIRVRGRVINLEDELFGLEPLNHAAWSRFALEADVDGLRDYLLSSREGVRDTDEIRHFRQYLLKVFNKCRAAYEDWARLDSNDLDIAALLADAPSVYVTEPLSRAVRETAQSGADSFYIVAPPDSEAVGRGEWMASYESDVLEKPVQGTLFVKQGPNAPALRYNPVTRDLIVNLEHPFVDKLTDGDKHRVPAKLFASSEVLVEGQLLDQGVERSAIANFLRDRDRILRLMAGDAPPTAREVLRRLDAAKENETALERAVGAVFQVLGFEYERKGGPSPGPDGVLSAKLGRRKDASADYRLVYDAKQTSQPSVAADKIDLASLDEFRGHENADFGFFIAAAYAAEADPAGALNRRMETGSGRCVTLLKVEHLHKLVWLHYRHGVTLSELRNLFVQARTVPQVDSWMVAFRSRLKGREVPLDVLLEGLEREKSDPMAVPSVIAVRAKREELLKYEPERLIARLKAAETIIGSRWIEVEKEAGTVVMHQSAEQTLAELESNIRRLAAADAYESPEVAQ